MVVIVGFGHSEFIKIKQSDTSVCFKHSNAFFIAVFQCATIIKIFCFGSNRRCGFSPIALKSGYFRFTRVPPVQNSSYIWGQAFCNVYFCVCISNDTLYYTNNYTFIVIWNLPSRNIQGGLNDLFQIFRSMSPHVHGWINQLGGPGPY